MVVHTGIAIGGSHLGEVLGSIAIGIETHIEFALAVGVTVVVDILIVEGHLDILAKVEIEGCTVEFGGTAINGKGTPAFVVVHIEEFILEGQFHIAPALAATDTVEFGTVGVVTLLATKEEAATFDVPALEMIRLVKDDLFRIHISPVSHPGTFDTEAIIVTSEFSGSDEVMVGVLDVVGIDIFLTASWVQNVVRQFGPYPAWAEEI